MVFSCRGIPLTLRGSAKELCLNGSTASLKHVFSTIVYSTTMKI